MLTALGQYDEPLGHGEVTLTDGLPVAERLVVLAEGSEHAFNPDTGRVERHDDHQVLGGPGGGVVSPMKMPTARSR